MQTKFDRKFFCSLTDTSRMGSVFDYDMIIIGSGPGGQRAAMQAAKLRKRVAIIESNHRVGGVSLHDGTIPSKSFREAILHLSGYRERTHYGKAYRVKQNITMHDLTSRCQSIITTIEQTTLAQFSRNGIELIHGHASLAEEHQVKVQLGKKEQILTAEFIVLATGTRPFRPNSFAFDDDVILDSDTILHMREIPKSLSVVGGGVIGCEYGSMFAALGTKVTIVEARSSLLSFVDRELVDALVYKLREQKVSIVVNDKVISCKRSPDGRAVIYLESGKRVVSDVVLISAGRSGNTKALNLPALGVECTDRGLIKVDEHFRTNIPNIYALGDVIGSPALASTAMEQGRRAALHAFRLPDPGAGLEIPYGIYTIPEIAMVGKTEQELSEQKVPYEVGIARFSEVERGKIIGEDSGILKIIFHRGTLQILGVHIIGDNAAELVHIGQMAMGLSGDIEFLARSVYNYPTLSQSYKTAALDGMNKIIATAGLPDEDPMITLDKIDRLTVAASDAVASLTKV